jgi:hypothetical protein
MGWGRGRDGEEGEEFISESQNYAFFIIAKVICEI